MIRMLVSYSSALGASLRGRMPRRALFSIAVLSLASALALGFVHREWLKREEMRESPTPLWKNPEAVCAATDARPSRMLSPYEPVQAQTALLDEVRGAIKVRTRAGEIGWIPAKSLFTCRG